MQRHIRKMDGNNPLHPVLRSAKRAPANVRRLNNISDVIFYCSVGVKICITLVTLIYKVQMMPYGKPGLCDKREVKNTFRVPVASTFQKTSYMYRWRQTLPSLGGSLTGLCGEPATTDEQKN